MTDEEMLKLEDISEETIENPRNNKGEDEE